MRWCWRLPVVSSAFSSHWAPLPAPFCCTASSGERSCFNPASGSKEHLAAAPPATGKTMLMIPEKDKRECTKMRKTVVMNVVGLTTGLLGPATPHLNHFAEHGSLATIHKPLPALTCPVQATYI